MTKTQSRLSILLVLATNVLVANAEDGLKHDPFVRPSLTSISLDKASENVEVEAPWTPVLTSIMLAGKRSLITLDGVIMKIGEEKDGYRLVQVKDHEATFVKGKKRVTLIMQLGVNQQNAEQGTPQASR